MFMKRTSTDFSAFVSKNDSFTHQPVSLNFPEENDETMSDDFLPRALVEPDREPKFEANPSNTPDCHCPPMTGYKLTPPVPPRVTLPRFPQTPFPSQAAAADSSAPDQYQWAWAYPSYTSGREVAGYGDPHSMPSCLPSSQYSSYAECDASLLPGRCHSLLASLEQPSSLRSFPPQAHIHTNTHAHPHHLNPYACHPPAPPAAPSAFRMGPLITWDPEPSTSSASGLPTPWPVRPQVLIPTLGTSEPAQPKGKVFVTYESDSEDHVKEIIKFVALLRHNGFDTHIDVFEQQLNSISKIDCTEKYIQEKDYLIIIAISPRYFEVVSGDSMFVERDERTLNTVYIHKQLQNEFIQNGCKNFRFIPVLFPGAKKSHIPTWLRNTHVYSWPKDRDDILRRLMRVEKYNPPPIGELPTIVPIPI